MWHSTAAATAPLPRLVTAADLDRAGVDRDVARRAATAGHWTPVLPGAWLRQHREVTRRDRQEAALALLGPQAVLSGADACLLLGLRDVPDDGRTTVLVPPSQQRRLGPDVRAVRTGDLPAPLLLDGLRCAPPGRAVLDAARASSSQRDVRALVLAAVADGWCGPDDLLVALDAGPRRGSGLARRAVGDALLGAASAPEAEMADVVRSLAARGLLPAPLLNPVLRLRGEVVGRPDGWLPGLGLGWECDSVRHHGAADALDATLQRSARFRRYGLELVHRSPRRFRADPGGFGAEMVRAAAVRRRLAQPEPDGLHAA